MLEVLVADDDENARESIAAALEEVGHRVTQARDGVEAAALMRTRDFDVAVCDVQMPRLDGLMLLRRIRREAPRTLVLLMTAHCNAEDAAESFRCGALAYVAKPFDPHEFARNVVARVAFR